MRIAIFGGPGSGKSTLADLLGDVCDLPVTHLDDIFHLPGWEELDTEAFRRAVAEIVATDDWVIDGNYSRVRDIVLPRVTHVVALDLPLPVMVWRIAYRTLGRRLGWRGVTPLPAQVHADGEPLIAATIGLSQNAVKYKRGHLRRILAEVAEARIPADAVRVITTTGGVTGVVEALAAELGR
ncbi:hypothetical protein CMK11_20640 [Candidatus Poribacteria bacterium]|jgi:hypothetical protein|nr:hypothetical protein [Candidatus Poribacteria bacterium]